MIGVFKTTIFFLYFSIVAFSQEPKTIILTKLDEQTKCWNRGDLNCFMDGYWKSDSLMFVGRNGITYGWQATLDNYKKNYPDRESMGRLSFDILEIKKIEQESFLVIGKWHLERTKDNLSGFFSLIWKKINGQWVIISDHSSAS